jgi:hypothetical protein
MMSMKKITTASPGLILYDPTNGTVSPGDVVWFNDGSAPERINNS